MENESCPPITIYQIIIPDNYNYCNTNVDITETQVNTYLSDLISWKSMDRILIVIIIIIATQPYSYNRIYNYATMATIFDVYIILSAYRICPPLYH